MKAIDKAKERQAAEALISMIEKSKEFAELEAASSQWLTVNLYIKGQYIDWKTDLRSSLEWMVDKPAETTDSDDEDDPLPPEEIEEDPTRNYYEAQSWAWCPNDDYRDKDWDEALGDALDDGCPIEDTEDTPSTVALAERQHTAFIGCVEDLQKESAYIAAWAAGLIGQGTATFNSPFCAANVNLPNPTNIAPYANDIPDEKIKELYSNIRLVLYNLTLDYDLHNDMGIGDRIIFEFKGKKDYVCEFTKKSFLNTDVTKILEHWDSISDGNPDWLDKARSRFREDMFHKFVAAVKNTDEYDAYMSCPDSGKLIVEYIGRNGTISETAEYENPKIHVIKKDANGDFVEQSNSAGKFVKLRLKILYSIPELKYLRNAMDCEDEIQMLFKSPEGDRYIIIPKEDQED